MHGVGVGGVILALSLYMIDAVAWMCFWIFCIIHRKNLFGEMTRYKWSLFIVVCVCLTVIGIDLAAFETFKRKNSDWWLILIGAVLPVFGIFYINCRGVKSVSVRTTPPCISDLNPL